MGSKFFCDYLKHSKLNSMSGKIKWVCLCLFFMQGMSSLVVGQSLGSFVPKGFEVLDTVSGDLNLDAHTDVILILKSKQETDTSDMNRPLLILEGIAKGKYKLAGRNDHIVFCASCGGAFGDPYQEVTIQKGSFSVMHYGGSAMRWTQNITFSYQAATGKFILKSDTGESFNANNPDKVKKIKNQKGNWNKISFEEYSNDEDDD
jgi:hypothetical protein